MISEQLFCTQIPDWQRITEPTADIVSDRAIVNCISLKKLCGYFWEVRKKYDTTQRDTDSGPDNTVVLYGEMVGLYSHKSEVKVDYKCEYRGFPTRVVYLHYMWPSTTKWVAMCQAYFCGCKKLLQGCENVDFEILVVTA